VGLGRIVPRKKVSFSVGAETSTEKSPPKKKVVKKKVAVKKRTRKKLSVDDLFDAKKPAPKKRGPKSHAELAEEKIIAENKRVAARRAAREKKTSTKNRKVYPSVTSPEDCKNILPAFKAKIKKQWKILEDGNLTEASTVASYINGVMAVCKDKRPKEYDELYVLKAIAKRIYSERSGH